MVIDPQRLGCCRFVRLLLRGHLLTVQVMSSVALKWGAVGRRVLALTEDLPLEVLESDHNDSDVVKGLSVE